MTETLAFWYSSESIYRELSNEYKHDRVFKNLCMLVLWMKVDSALEGIINAPLVITIFILFISTRWRSKLFSRLPYASRKNAALKYPWGRDIYRMIGKQAVALIMGQPGPQLWEISGP